MTLEPGLTGTAKVVVAAENTAVRFGSGDVEVFGTPAVVALCEAAAVDSLKGHLDAAQTSVGTWIGIDHLAPTPVGATVQAEAVLTSADGRKLTFEVSASDGSGDIARGEHRRVVVDRARFMETSSGRR